MAGFYKAFLSGSLGMGGCCRFYPSCGDYAIEAYKSLPFLKATAAVVRRLASCRPFGPADPGGPHYKGKAGCKTGGGASLPRSCR